MICPAPLQFNDTTIHFSSTVVMGILNTTPDSFSDGGLFLTPLKAAEQLNSLIHEGCQIIDIGAESTRPGSSPVSADEEIARITPVFKAIDTLRHNTATSTVMTHPWVVSIDTSKSEVADFALQRGAEIVNDVNALGDFKMGSVIAHHNAKVILMHMRGKPRTMQSGEIKYDNLIGEINDFFAEKIDYAVRRCSIPKENIMLDPGIGFGKSLHHNLTLTQQLDMFHGFNLPIVYGPSRKKFLGEITARPVQDRDRATAAVTVAAIGAGAHIIRVHNPGALTDAIKIADKLYRQ